MNFDNKLLNDIELYCNLNELNVDEFVNDLLKKAFMVEKYGSKPPFMIKEEKPEKKEEEKPIEKPIKEVLVEEPKEIITETIVKEENNGEEEEFKLVEKKVKKPRKRKLA